MAACWSSYLELVSQAVAGSKIRIRWDDFKRTFLARFGAVISVMFAFWIISYVTTLLDEGPNGPALAGVIGFAMAFFFNAVPELLYQGHSRSFALLMDSARFMFRFPVVWLLPNVLFAALALWAAGLLQGISHPAEALIVFGSIFSAGGHRRDLRRHSALVPAARARRPALRDDLPRNPVPRARLGRRQHPPPGLPGQDARLTRGRGAEPE